MSKKHSFACVALLCVLALQNAQAGSGGTGGSGDDFPPYEVGDIVTGNLWSYGGQELFNSTRGCKIRVFMEGHR